MGRLESDVGRDVRRDVDRRRVALRCGGSAGLELFLDRASVSLVEVDAAQGREASRAFSRFGKGRHPAGLNFGDCFSDALARRLGEPLLFKGRDFSATDVEPAVPGSETGSG